MPLPHYRWIFYEELLFRLDAWPYELQYAMLTTRSVRRQLHVSVSWEQYLITPAEFWNIYDYLQSDWYSLWNLGTSHYLILSTT